MFMAAHRVAQRHKVHTVKVHTVEASTPHVGGGGRGKGRSHHLHTIQDSMRNAAHAPVESVRDRRSARKNWQTSRFARVQAIRKCTADSSARLVTTRITKTIARSHLAKYSQLKNSLRGFGSRNQVRILQYHVQSFEELLTCVSHVNL